MAKTKKQKQKILEKYIERLEKSDSFIVIDPDDITANEATSLRKSLRQMNSTFNVVKNSLIKLAFKKQNIEMPDIEFVGENAIIFCGDDPSLEAKVIYEFIEDSKKGQIKGGFLAGTTLSTTDVEELAKLPPKEQLIGMTVSTIAAPLSGFVNVLNANLSNLVNVIKNISENKEN